MALAEDVIGIFDELRRAEGTLRRARVVGRLWGAVRKLPSEERRELASILAERYAPSLLERLSQGQDVEAAELLGIVRTVGKVDADEISEIMDQIRDAEGRRELLADVAESLQDDVAGADIGSLLDDPDARAAALSAAALGVAEDLDAIEIAATEGDEDPGREPPADGEAETPAVETTERLQVERGGGPGAEFDPDGSPPVSDVPEVSPEPAEPEVAVDAAPDPDAPTDADMEPEPSPGPDSGSGPSPTGEEPRPAVADADRQAPPAVPSDIAAELAGRLAAAASPIGRLRALRASTATAIQPSEARTIIAAFPDGWQRRRAVLALADKLEPESMPTMVAAIGRLGSRSDRRWVVRTLTDTWQLDEADAETLAAASDVPPSAARLAQSG